MQHYHQALSAQTTASSPDELLSGGVFLRHFLLFIYDICIPMRDDSGDTDMWTIHLSHLQRIATLRYERFGYEPHAYLLWCICELDMYACLLGSGNCNFVRTILQHNMLPPLDQQLPLVVASLLGTYLANETSTFPDILALNQAIVIQTAKLAQIAQTYRNEAMDSDKISPGTTARWQAGVSQLQNELNAFWTQTYPQYLDSEDPRAAGEELPSRVRYVFEHVSTAGKGKFGCLRSVADLQSGIRSIPKRNDIQPNEHVPRTASDSNRKSKRHTRRYGETRPFNHISRDSSTRTWTLGSQTYHLSSFHGGFCHNPARHQDSSSRHNQDL